MLTLLAKDRFFWTLRLAGRPLEESRHRARWEVACIEGPVSVRYQHALKTLRQLSPKKRAQLAPTHAFARHLAIDVAIDIYWVVVETPNYPSILALSNCVVEEPPWSHAGDASFGRSASPIFQRPAKRGSILMLRPLS